MANGLIKKGREYEREAVFSRLSRVLTGDTGQGWAVASEEGEALADMALEEEDEARLFAVEAAAALETLEAAPDPEETPAASKGTRKEPRELVVQGGAKEASYRGVRVGFPARGWEEEREGMGPWHSERPFLSAITGRRISPPWYPGGAAQVISPESSEAQGLFRRENMSAGLSILPMCAGVRLLEATRVFRRPSVAVDIGWRETHVAILAPSAGGCPVPQLWIFGFGWDCIATTVVDRLKECGGLGGREDPPRAFPSQSMVREVIATGECLVGEDRVALEGIKGVSRELLWRGLSAVLDRSVGDAEDFEEIALIAPGFLHECLIWSLDVRRAIRRDVLEPSEVAQAWEDRLLVDAFLGGSTSLEVV
ncbi:hypothetical protein [Amorphus sp. 3PC139-8]|uniref:hypothetical protein n=1 Tax=Amorphus sp. 3PC139-8 TaxID=2735676 RepID=UPI00345CC16A